MKKAISIGLLAVLGIGAGFAILQSTKEQSIVAKQEEEKKQIVSLNGVVSLDVENYLNDSRVKDILLKNKFQLDTKRIGSREMADYVSKNSVDFAFPSGVVASNQILSAMKGKGNPISYNVMFTPMVIASYQDVADILVSNKSGKKIGEKIYSADTNSLVKAILAKKKWSDFKFNEAYNPNRSLMIYTTDLRKSNSSAMYLALSSYIMNDNEVITSKDVAKNTALKVADLYKRQGYQENYVSGNFDDYKQGKGKSPLAFIYEFQMYEYALKNNGLKEGMVLMYPSPTIVNKEVFVALSDKSKELAELFMNNKELQAIAVEYGFRTESNIDLFVSKAKENKLFVLKDVVDQVDPPSFDIMQVMIDTISKEMSN